MAIPLFTGPVASLGNPGALDVGINSIDLRGRAAGQQLAQGQENIEGTRLENEGRRVALDQEEQLAPLKLAAAKEKLQSDIQLDPLRAQAEQQKLQQEQDQYAQQVKLQNQQSQLTSIFQNGTDEEKIAAVTSGQFVDLFGASPALEKSAIEVTYPKMSADQKEAFGARIQNNDLRDFYQKQQAAVNQKYQTALAEVTGDQTTGELQREFYPNLSMTQVPSKVKLVRSDAFFTDPDTGEVKPAAVPPQGKPTAYTAFDIDTGRVLKDGISPETQKRFSDMLTQRNLAAQLGLPVANYSIASRTVDQIQSRTPAPPPVAPPPAIGLSAPRSPEGSISGGSLTGGGTDIGHGVIIPQRTPVQNEFFNPAPGVQVKNPNFQGPSAPGASSANTPDTNQAPVAKAQDKVLNSVIGDNPLYQQQATEKNNQFRGFTEQLGVGKEDATFPVAVGQTAQLYTNADYRPEQIKSGVVDRVNADPLLIGKPPLVKALAAVESQGRRNAVSPTGVKGLLQVTKSTAGQYGLDRDVPEENVLAGEKELYRNLKLVKTPELALAAYNAGIGNVLDAIKATNSYDWDVVKEYLRDNLHPRKFKEVSDYPERVLNYAAAFATQGTEV